MTQGITIGDIELEIDGVLSIGYRCPRCDTRNSTIIHAKHLVGMLELDCVNPACGKSNFWMFITLDGNGGYKDINDIPLRPASDATSPLVDMRVTGN